MGVEEQVELVGHSDFVLDSRKNSGDYAILDYKCLIVDHFLAFGRPCLLAQVRNECFPLVDKDKSSRK